MTYIEFRTHHYNEILRLKKGKNLSTYDSANKYELIKFLDDEIKTFTLGA